MANFKITSTTTVSELKEQFRKEFGGVLRVYEGRSEASDSAKLVSLGATEGEFECRANRTVGSFEEDFKKEFNLKVKVYTKDNWVAVLDGITLASVNDIPKSATKASMEEFVGYKREDKNDIEVKNEMNMNFDSPKSYEKSVALAEKTTSVAIPLYKFGDGGEFEKEVKENPYDFLIFFTDGESHFLAFDPMEYNDIEEFLKENPDFTTIYYTPDPYGDIYMSEQMQSDYENPDIWPDEEGNKDKAVIKALNQTQTLDYPPMEVDLIYNGEIIYTFALSY